MNSVDSSLEGESHPEVRFLPPTLYSSVIWSGRVRQDLRDKRRTLDRLIKSITQ